MIRQLARAVPNAAHTVREWYRDDRVGRRVDSTIVVLLLLAIVISAMLGLTWAFMWLAS